MRGEGCGALTKWRANASVWGLSLKYILRHVFRHLQSSSKPAAQLQLRLSFPTHIRRVDAIVTAPRVQVQVVHAAADADAMQSSMQSTVQKEKRRAVATAVAFACNGEAQSIVIQHDI